MRPPRPGQVTFLYEDKDIIAVDKPAGLPVIAPEGSRSRNLLDLVSRHIQRHNPKGRAAVVHRLDRDTSGVLVFATNARAKTALMGNWQELATRRCYVALVEGSPPAEDGLLDSWLLELGPSRVGQVAAGTPGALRALTHYRVLERYERHCLLELELDTGRRHQIRVQLAAIGCPVAGDATYGARTDPAGRLCLHASRLELEHPFSGQRLVLESQPPKFLPGRRQR
ncbi:MAG: hypothetical protein A2087_04865 [Spirochaetes bacterium GWD1_61_31]|nr:MAG: hypothetical protein A2Y37_01595 [Spirochaetes bacterium GWB1_60_80]OHD34940.1 MAG: hypothetical protein A2004_00625 [Spirochaetes bacterium GWC1_61_12]OHD37092.1 MAG: hypothetical protein A2087_04865 [Spirochaetes bacterium GWD1_61_31]OHD45356.1 MAG: hypothetical protein A2Y35_00525 [Spirochaetes bacterium GWE1_60_18]OHD61110.1 MAG: hypothetical protein A2Y32_09210 [Spirochaetes bacterium GWF1_60_12]